MRKQLFLNGDLYSAIDSIRVGGLESCCMNIGNCSISIRFFTIVGVAWFCEKMDINVKFISNDDSFLENSMLVNSQKSQCGEFTKLKSTTLWENYAKVNIPSEYGHQVISKLAIKKELHSQADEWIDNNIQGDWIGVHYRGTDANRRYIAEETYTAYLQKVLDARCNIYACSDQAQFITQIKRAFPGRVFTREIIRSYDSKSLHGNSEYRGDQQRQDALLDILILSKAKLIYTTGSWFVDMVRFFNPSIKIVTFEMIRSRFNYYGEINNFIPVPKASFLEGKLKRRKRPLVNHKLTSDAP